MIIGQNWRKYKIFGGALIDRKQVSNAIFICFSDFQVIEFHYLSLISKWIFAAVFERRSLKDEQGSFSYLSAKIHFCGRNCLIIAAGGKFFPLFLFFNYCYAIGNAFHR